MMIRSFGTRTFPTSLVVVAMLFLTHACQPVSCHGQLSFNVSHNREARFPRRERVFSMSRSRLFQFRANRSESYTDQTPSPAEAYDANSIDYGTTQEFQQIPTSGQLNPIPYPEPLPMSQYQETSSNSSSVKTTICNGNQCQSGNCQPAPSLFSVPVQP